MLVFAFMRLQNYLVSTYFFQGVFPPPPHPLCTWSYVVGINDEVHAFSVLHAKVKTVEVQALLVSMDTTQRIGDSRVRVRGLMSGFVDAEQSPVVDKCLFVLAWQAICRTRWCATTVMF